MKTCVKMELKKALHSKYFIISLIIMTVFALLSAVSVSTNYQSAVSYYRINNFENGKMVANDLYPTWTSYNWWIGGESFSLVYSLFFTLIPVFAVLPYAASYYSERKSGYLRNIYIRSNKKNYIVAKLTAVFVSGSLVVLIPLAVNLAIVSAFLPTSVPQVNYSFYNHVSFGSMWADLFFSVPLLYTIFYILLNGLFAGLFALSAFAVSFFIKNKFVILFLPFLIVLGLNYISDSLVNSYETVRWTVEFAPNMFLHAAQIRFDTIWWVVFLEAFMMLLFSVITILTRGRKNEIF